MLVLNHRTVIKFILSTRTDNVSTSFACLCKVEDLCSIRAALSDGCTQAVTIMSHLNHSPLIFHGWCQCPVALFRLCLLTTSKKNQHNRLSHEPLTACLLLFHFTCFKLSLLLLVFSHHHATQLFLSWSYKNANKVHYYHHPHHLLTPLRVAQNLQAMTKGAEIAHVLVSNPLCHSNCLHVLSFFRNVPADTITSAFVVVVLLPRLSLASRLKISPRKKVLLARVFLIT